jgi:hypothetical protein
MVLILNDVRSNNPGWAECDPAGIFKLEFSFLGKDMVTGKDVSYDLTMSGMKEYNFFVEAMRGIGKGRTVVKGLWFMGKIPNNNRITGFVLRDKILSLNTEVGKEYLGMSTIGWKKGIIGDEIVSAVLRRK